MKKEKIMEILKGIKIEAEYKMVLIETYDKIDLDFTIELIEDKLKRLKKIKARK